MKNHKIFDNHPVNCGRQPEVDLSKAVRIFLLAFVHCTIECTSDEGLETGIPYLFDTVIGGPLGAPLFIFAARGTQELPILPVMIIALFISVTSITISHLWSCGKSNP